MYASCFSHLKHFSWDFPAGPMVKNPPANTQDTGHIELGPILLLLLLSCFSHVQLWVTP